MASYISYAEKQAASQINWAEVSKNLSDTLYKEAEIRQEKKDAIDKATREFGQKLNDAPTGEYRNGSEWILNYANSASEMRLIQDRLLKSGQLSLRDYNIGRQNLVDGTNNLFTLMDEYQTEYSRKMKEYQDGGASGANLDIMESAEGMANLTTTEAYINPTSFNVNLATMKKNKEGVFEMDGNFVSIPALRNRIKMDVKKYDVNTNARTEASKLGKASVTEIQRIKNARGLISITQITDPRNKDVLSKEDSDLIGKYEEWEKNTVSSIIQNDFNLLSIVRDGLAGDYKVTFDKEEFKSNKNTIYMNTESGGAIVPEFHPEQKAAAEELLKEQIRNYIDQDTKVQVVTEQAPQQPREESEGSRQARGAKEKQFSTLENWMRFGTGTAQEKATAKAALLADGAKDGLMDIVSDGRNITFVYSDQAANLTVEVPNSTKDWVAAGKSIHGVEGSEANTKMGDYYKKPMTGNWGKAAAVKRAGKLDRAQAAANVASNINLPELVIKDDAKGTAARLNNALSPYGIKVTPDVSYGFGATDSVTFRWTTDKGPQEIKMKIDYDTQVAAAIVEIEKIIENFGKEDALRNVGGRRAPR
jgi:hypothetical protein